MAEKKSAKEAEQGSSTQKKTATKKTTPKKRVAKSAPKKAPEKKPAKTVAAAKKPAKKTARKTAAKRTTKKESVESPYQTELTEKNKTEEKDTYPDDTVSLPRDASVRAQERAALIAYLSDRNIDRFIERMTKIIGIFILMLGVTTSSMALYASELVSFGSQRAEVISGTAGTTSPSGDPITNALPFDPANLVVEYNVNDKLTSVHDVVIKTNAGSNVVAFLKNTQTGAKHQLDLYEARPDQHKWIFKANVNDLPAGSYVVLAKVSLETLIVETYSHTVQVVRETSNTGTSATTDSTETTATTTVTTNTSGTNSTGDEGATTATTPVVKFLNVPSVVSAPILITLKAVYADSVSLIVRDKARTSAVRLNQVSADTLLDTVTFKLDSLKFEPGEYDMLANAKSDAGSYNFESKRFLIERATEPTTSTVTTTNEAVGGLDGTVATTETPTTDPATEPAAMTEPTIRVVFDSVRSTERYRVYAIEAKGAKFVEMYSRSLVSATPTFLGLATRVNDERYAFSIDTKSVPNGTYFLTARARIGDTLPVSKAVEYRVQNTTTTLTTEPSTETAAQASVLKTDIQAIDKVVTEVTETAPTPKPTPTQSGSEAVDAIQDPVRDGSLTYSKQLLDTYRTDIEEALQRYTSALRSGDPEAIERTKQSLESLSDRIVLEDYQDDRTAQFIADLEEHIDARVSELTEQTENTERIIKERTNDSIAIDTDGDGIPDYDEITIYKTDPNVADTDNDGFIDGAEILSGFNPNDASYEALIEYESPQDSGVVREDILVVEGVETLLSKPDQPDLPARAEITGRALPNSFVTLYIFSTPIVVTLQTRDDGSWSYTFDKELEDGTHEVYVGLTDNTGKVIAKSNPFRFVKEAQAFTPVDASAGTIVSTPEEQPLSSPFTTPLVLGLTLLVVGLMLIMLGYYLERVRPGEQEGVQPA